MTLEEIFEEAKRKDVGLLSITDHDSIDCQEQAKRKKGRWGEGNLTNILRSLADKDVTSQ